MYTKSKIINTKIISVYQRCLFFSFDSGPHYRVNLGRLAICHPDPSTTDSGVRLTAAIAASPVASRLTCTPHPSWVQRWDRRNPAIPCRRPAGASAWSVLGVGEGEEGRGAAAPAGAGRWWWRERPGRGRGHRGGCLGWRGACWGGRERSCSWRSWHSRCCDGCAATADPTPSMQRIRIQFLKHFRVIFQ